MIKTCLGETFSRALAMSRLAEELKQVYEKY